MSRIGDIERQILALSPEELAAFPKWFLEFDAEAWDRHIEEDIRAGKSDALADADRKAFESGKRSES